VFVLQEIQVMTRVQEALAGPKAASMLGDGLGADDDLKAVFVHLDHRVTVRESSRNRVGTEYQFRSKHTSENLLIRAYRVTQARGRTVGRG
jgi:hypothetical protein